MHDTLRFWLDRGVDGFRMDVIHAIGKDPALPDNPPEVAAIPHSGLNDTPRTHELLRRIRALLELLRRRPHVGGRGVPPRHGQGRDVPGRATSCTWRSTSRRCSTKWRAHRWARRLDDVATHIEPAGWPTWVLSNHDVAPPPHPLRLRGSGPRRRASCCSGSGGRRSSSPARSSGLEDAEVPRRAGRRSRRAGRLPCPAAVGPGRPVTAGARPSRGCRGRPIRRARNVEALRDDPASILHLYRALLAARKASPALQVGTQARIDAPEGVLVWERTLDGDRRLVAVNFTEEPVEVPGLAGTVEVSSDRSGEGEPFSGTLAPDQAVWLRP